MEHLCALNSHQLKQSSRHVTQTSRDVTHDLYMHATHCLCWSGYRWHQQMNAILMSLLWCRLQIAAAIELIKEVCQHSWLVYPTRWVTVVDWHFLTESFLPWCKKTFSYSQTFIFMVRCMNIRTDKQTQLTFPMWMWACLCSPQQWNTSILCPICYISCQHNHVPNA